MIDIAKTLAPGTLPFSMLVASAGLLLIRRRGLPRRIGVTSLVLLAAGYFVLALPATADRLSAGLTRFGRLPDSDRARRASTIVVIGGDSEHARELETLRLFHLVHPRWIVSSGPLEMRDALVAGGIPPERIVTESTARTTREQAVTVAQLVRSRHLDPVVLVASAIHMPRALAAFREAGIDAVPSASATRPIAGLPRFWPAYDALRLSRESIYEYAALTYYQRKGWLAGKSD
jgi:uncharacterized SAM-binding protein YcdF (DUF218 family)